jgi:hypothetical protein
MMNYAYRLPALMLAVYMFGAAAAQAGEADVLAVTVRFLQCSPSRPW